MTTPASALIADIGATNARFALLDGGELAVSETYAVADYASPIEAARHFLAGPAAGHTPKRAFIAAAGPVEHGRIALTNAAWIVDSDRISKGLGMTDVQVLNDFEALAWSLPALRPEHIVTLGTPRVGERGTMAVMGPGSGFGLAAMAFAGDAEVVLVTEGGHATLSSENRREDAIILALRQQFHHVSVERVLSGSGLMQLYHAIARVDDETVPERDSSEIVGARARRRLQGEPRGPRAVLRLPGQRCGQCRPDAGRPRWRVHRRRNSAALHRFPAQLGLPRALRGQGTPVELSRPDPDGGDRASDAGLHRVGPSGACPQPPAPRLTKKVFGSR